MAFVNLNSTMYSHPIYNRGNVCMCVSIYVSMYLCLKPKGFLTTAPIVTIFGMDHLCDLISSLMGSRNRSINHQSLKSIIQSIISPYLLNYCSDFDHFWHGSSLGP